MPRSPVYEPDSPGPVQERETWVPSIGEGAPEEQQSRTAVSNLFDSRNRASDRDAIASSERPRSPLEEEHSQEGFSFPQGNWTKKKA